ncbi:MAG: Ldh family oxidoreductase [Thaumarchaeota archaeon]|nr:Ldh family oxidoreductase [Nitrososphaerota archaeon]
MKEGNTGKLISHSDLLVFATSVFEAAGADQENARIVGEHLVEASLRGVDSHGVVRVPVYVQGITEGAIDPAAKPEVAKETETTAVVDGKRGFGQVAALLATRVAAEKAKKSGTAAVGAKDLNHVGVLGYYGGILARQGFVGKAYTSGFPRAAPWGGREKLFGTNPLCFAFPVGDGDPIVIDIATTAVAGFKIIQAAKAGRAIPEGWAVDPDGSPTTDPKLGLQGSMMPMAGHKGYGLAVSVEILSRILAGNVQRKMTREVAYTQAGFLVEAIHVGAFREEADYYRDVAELVAQIRNSAPARGFDRVLLPGEPEEISRVRRAKEGIPVEATTWKEFEDVAARFSVELPPPQG